MNTQDITNRRDAICDFIDAACTQYNSSSVTDNTIPEDYHVLFLLVRSFTAKGITYTIPANSVKENIFYEAVENFKHSVETFAKKNVHIITTIKIIPDNIIIPGNTRECLIYEDFLSYLKKFSSMGLYDAVIAAASDSPLNGGRTTYRTFSFEEVLHSFSHCPVVESDSSRINNNYPMEYPHLTTTNFFIHEWLHQLEFYEDYIVEFFPSVHGYQNPDDYGYSWDEYYFDNTSQYPYIVEPRITSFYRAILAYDVTYTNGTINKKIGVFPLFWKITPRNVMIGRCTVQENSGDYCYNNNGIKSTTSNLLNDMRYVWNVYYSIPHTEIRLRNFSENGDAYIAFSEQTNLIFTKLGPYDEGQYYLINKELSNTILSYTLNNILQMEGYKGNYTKTFNLEYYSELYFTLTASELTNKYLDLYNNWNNEDNNVNLGGWSGFPTAQTWQYRFDGTDYKIMPLKSPTRSLSFHDNALHITSVSNIQNWCPKHISNGKYIFPGTYKIKKAGFNQYLTYSGSNLKLSTSGKTWTIQELGNNYYSISNSNGTSTYYFDVLNTYDFDGNIVQVHTATSYTDAQSWRIILTSNNNFIIVPQVSLTRGITSTTSNSTLSTSPTEFCLVKV